MIGLKMIERSPTFGIVIILLLTLSFSNCFDDKNDGNDKESIPFANSDDIDIIISPNTIKISNFNQTIIIHVEMKNIALDEKKIIKSIYTKPTESIWTYAITTNSSYSYIIEHDDGDWSNEPETILKPNESFSFQIEVPLSSMRDVTTKKYMNEENPDYCICNIKLRIRGESGFSNEIKISKK